MKHKRHHPIPDFSNKRAGHAVPPEGDGKATAPPPRAPVRPKPQATNAKSGRRGQ